MFLLPIVYVIPMVTAWIGYAKQKTALALVLTTRPWFYSAWKW
jgi:hypothetical protein